MRQKERELDLSHLAPVLAIRRLVEFKFDYVSSHPLLISLLSGENLNEARHLKRSKRLRSMHSPLVETLSGLLKAGVAERYHAPRNRPRTALHIHRRRSAISISRTPRRWLKRSTAICSRQRPRRSAGVTPWT